jgi:hypothetical protein
MAQSFTIVDLLLKLFDWFTCFAISNLFKSNYKKKKKKGKTLGKGTREEKRKDQSPNKRPHSKAQNTQ